ncbi:MAG: molybdopterin-dependent oxidoreductase [Caldilinea sp.]|nr:molybdopterin-dependent oxidoreductase [Caldilinea sp.]
MTRISLSINQHDHDVEIDAGRSLLSVLREDLALTGTKYGCGDGKCGACTVLVDGNPVQACSVAAVDVAGTRITTVEGLAAAGRLDAVQAAFVEASALQCGYCTPGMIMTATALLAADPDPSGAEIMHALQDNICRCGAHPRIVAAVRQAAAWLRAGAWPDYAATPAEPAAPLAPDRFEDGLVVAYPDPDVAAAAFGDDAPPPDRRTLTQIGPLVQIAEDGTIRVFVGKAEVGQNMRASVAQLVAEELRVAPEQVEVIAADTGRDPYDVGTFGSRTTPITGPQVLRAGAAMRGLLVDLAAATWGAPPAELSVLDGAVVHAATARQATFGELARDRQITRIADPDQPVTPPAEWTVAGRPMRKPNGAAIVTGSHRFAADMVLPGMLAGKVLRPPAFRATLEALDTDAAGHLPGVTVVRDGDFVGVVAPDELAATRAIDALRARWQTALQVSSPELFDYLKATALERESQRDPEAVPADGWRGPLFTVTGEPERAMAGSAQQMAEAYTVDYIAHAPLEPRAALAVWQDDRLTVWTGSQRPFGVQAELAAFFGIDLANVRVIVPETGAGYGGKHAGDAAIEAARLARAVGRPVKIVWTRQEEFTWAYFRPAGLIELASAVDEAGYLTVLEMTNYNSGAAGIESRYAIPNQRITFLPADPPLRQGAYRALATTANHFARESHIDGWAYRLGEDPLAFRLRHIDDPRLRAVFEAAALHFGWDSRSAAANHGFGIAGGSDKGSYVAACVEVAVDPASGVLTVLHVVEAFECGAIINPDNVRAQVEGAIIQGLGGALYESVRFANGRILNPGFDGYRVPRFLDLPRIETVLLDRRDLPSVGAGETPILAIAPAIANAVFHATGRRLRAMPLAPDGMVAL